MPPARAALLAAVAVVLLAVVTYAPVVRYGFVELDDPFYVYLNPGLTTATGSAAVRYAFTSDLGGNWHPLVWASFFLDRWAWGLQPGPMHAENVALHAASAAVLLLLLYDATGRLGRSAVVAAVFAAHPMHVESVAWISERKDVLSTLPLLLAAWAYVRYGRATTGRRQAGWYAAVVAAFALSLTGKSMGLTLPAVLLLLDVWPLRRRAIGWPRLVAEKLPLFAMSAAIAVVTVAAQRASGATALVDVPLSGRLANAVVAYVTYAGKLAVPVDLAVFYPFRDDLPAAAAAVAAVLLAAATAAAVRWRQGRPYLLVGWLWFLGTLVPTIGLVQVGGQAMADRYSYLPSIGLTVAVVWLVADLVGRRAGAVVATAVVAGFAVAAHRQVRSWQSTRALFDQAVAATGDNYYAEEAIGYDEMSNGHRAEAADHFRRAVGLNAGRTAGSFDGLGVIAADAGRMTEAVDDCRTAVRLQPGAVAYRLHFARALAAAGDRETAAAEYRLVLSAAPTNRAAIDGLAALSRGTGPR